MIVLVHSKVVCIYVIFSASFVVTSLRGLCSFIYLCTYHVWKYHHCNIQLLYLTLDGTENHYNCDPRGGKTGIRIEV